MTDNPIPCYQETDLKYLPEGIIAETMIGEYSAGGGCTGEFFIRCEWLGGKSVPYIRAYDDSWKVLAKHSRLLEALSSVANKGISQSTLTQMLKRLGFAEYGALK